MLRSQNDFDRGQIVISRREDLVRVWSHRRGSTSKSESEANAEECGGLVCRFYDSPGLWR